MSRLAKNHASSVIAIEIRRSSLAMARMEPLREDGTRGVRTHLVPWRNESRSLHSDEGVRELSAAMKTLVAQEKLAGARVGLTLTGDYCVTRTVTGDTEGVRRELAMIEERSEMYLSLGTGPKSVAASIHDLDARHQHAVLAIANSNTLDAVLKVATDTGLAVSLVEPSLVALCRLLGSTGRDADEPVLIVDVSESGADVGISHGGQLLLDYQPGGRSAPDELAEVVMEHLGRLRRYCDRYYGFARGRLSKVFICGATEPVDSAVAKFAEHGELSVEVLMPASVDPGWQFAEADTNPAICAALGTCLQSCSAAKSPPGPNLAERVSAEQSRPILLEVCRSLWPVAAAAVVAFGIFLANWHEQAECSRVARDLDQLESVAVELWRLRYEMAEADTKIDLLEALGDSDDGISWKTMLSTLAKCMPQDLWLDKVTIDRSGQVALGGSSFREGTIHDFVSNLEPAPGWSQPAIEGTQSASSKLGPTTRFDIQCKFDAWPQH
jgi:type IV pilus assembly PilN-like protein